MLLHRGVLCSRVEVAQALLQWRAVVDWHCRQPREAGRRRERRSWRSYPGLRPSRQERPPVLLHRASRDRVHSGFAPWALLRAPRTPALRRRAGPAVEVERFDSRTRHVERCRAALPGRYRQALKDRPGRPRPYPHRGSETARDRQRGQSGPAAKRRRYAARSEVEKLHPPETTTLSRKGVVKMDGSVPSSRPAGVRRLSSSRCPSICQSRAGRRAACL